MINYENFAIVPTDETQDEWTIACPKGRMTERTFKTPEEAKEYIDTKPWDLIMTAAAMIAHTINERN